MPSFALGVLSGGLVLAVFAMLYGTERRVPASGAPHERRSEHDRAAEPSAIFNLASFAAFAMGFGLSAYLLNERTAFGPAVRSIVAVAIGSATLALQSLLLVRWAIPSARADSTDHRYLMQGSIGSIVGEVPQGGVGEMAYEIDGLRYTLPVRSVQDYAITAGTEVVLDRVEEGVAFVELWAEVERRL